MSFRPPWCQVPWGMFLFSEFAKNANLEENKL